MATASPDLTTESNEVLKLKFRKLHTTVVDNVRNLVKIVDFLFQETVISHDDVSALQRSKDDARQQCRDLLNLVHSSAHPQSFVKLYFAIKKEPDLQWLVEEVDKFTDQSLIDLLTQLYSSEPTVGQVVYMLPEGEPVWGVTSLAGKVYVVREKERDQVEMYDAISFRLQRCLTVPNAGGFIDMTSCEYFCCVYIANYFAECVHRLDSQGDVAQWAVNAEPWGISTNADHSVLVTCPHVQMIKEFGSHGDLLRELTLPDNVINPWHAIQLAGGTHQFVVCHGKVRDAVHRVCKIVFGEDSRSILRSDGGQPGSDAGQYNAPRHLAVDDYEFVFVVDRNNRRAKLLSPTLGYVRQFVWEDAPQRYPFRLYYDTQHRRLYVAYNTFTEGSITAGCVAVFECL